MNKINKDKNFKNIKAQLLENKNEKNKRKKIYFIAKNKINMNNIIHEVKYFIIKKLFLKIFIFINLIFYIESKNNLYNNRMLEENLETIEIIVNITESGEHLILNNSFNSEPIYVEVNGTIKNLTNDKKLTLESNIYLIKLIWNSPLQNLKYIFSEIPNIIEINFSNFNTSKVENMNYMFHKCIHLKKITFGNNFDTSSVKAMEYMFSNLISITSLNLSFFNTSSVEAMKKMFYNFTSLEYLDVSTFDTSKVKTFNMMFQNCISLMSLDLTSFNTENVTDMNEMFLNCKSLISLNIASFNTKSVTQMNKLFSGCNSLTSIDLSSFDTSSATQMDSFFMDCYSLKNIDVSKFNTSSIDTMRSMFKDCRLITYLNLSNFDTSKTDTMENMFLNCHNLTSINFPNFDTSQVTNLNRFLEYCESLKYIDLYNFNTSQVQNMYRMFHNCQSLTSLNLSNFNTEKAISFEGFFYNCTKLTSIDLSNFNSSNVINMKSMFYNCKSLTHLNLSNFDTLLVTNMIDMFSGCSNLKYLNIKNFKENDTLDNKNMLKNTLDNIIYCIDDRESSNKINIFFEEKECKYKDCDINWKENYENMIDNKKNNINVINDKCVNKDIISISKDFYFSNKISNTSIYSYEIGADDELKYKNTNLTFIEISQEQKKELLNKFNLNENETLYIFIYDTPSNDSRTAISEYNYNFILANGTKLNLSEINEDIFISVTVPIRNLDLANFDLVEKFSQIGYDIYNKSSNFYNDICSPASINDNDITLKDRKEDIYPNNVTLCKENCQYKNVDIENKRIICECNLNSNYEKENNNSSLQESQENFISYFLDNINYKIFKCYHLFCSFDNLILNPSFYTMIIALVIITFFAVRFFYCGIANIRVVMHKEIPTEKKLKELIIKKKLSINEKFKINNAAPKRKISNNITEENKS